MARSDYEADLYLNSRWRDAGAMAALGTVYVAFAFADLTRANLTANLVALGTGGYARLAVGTTNSDWSAPASSGGYRMIANLLTITGATLSADLNSGNPIGFYGIYDAATAGNLLRQGAFATPRTFLNGDTIVIAPGALQLFD